MHITIICKNNNLICIHTAKYMCILSINTFLVSIISRYLK